MGVEFGMQTRQQCRSPHQVTSELEAFEDQEEGFGSERVVIRVGDIIFADPECWRNCVRDGEEIVRFTWGGIGQIWFYANRTVFLNSTKRLVAAS